MNNLWLFCIFDEIKYKSNINIKSNITNSANLLPTKEVVFLCRLLWILQMSGTLPGTYCTSVPQAIIIFGYVVLRKNNFKSTAKCVLQVFIWTEMATEAATTYELSVLCSSHNPATTRSLGRLSPLKWLLIKREFVLIEWRLSPGFTAYYWAASQWHMSK